MAILSAETRRRLAENDRRWHIKYSLRIVALITSFIAIILIAAAVSLWDANFYYEDSVNSGDWSDGLALAPVRFHSCPLPAEKGSSF